MYEAEELDAINHGCDMTADKLREIAVGGRPHGGVFGSEKVEACAQAIIDLRDTIRLLIGNKTYRPWREIDESQVDSHVQQLKWLRENFIT